MKRLLIIFALATSPLLLANQLDLKEDNVSHNEIKQKTRMKTDSGSEYTVLKEGSGASPEINQSVAIHYTYWTDVNGEPGEKISSSIDHGKPFIFQLGRSETINPLDQNLPMMKIGEKRRLYIPARFKTRGSRSISNLILDIELINIK